MIKVYCIIVTDVIWNVQKLTFSVYTRVIYHWEAIILYDKTQLTMYLVHLSGIFCKKICIMYIYGRKTPRNAKNWHFLSTGMSWLWLSSWFWISSWLSLFVVAFSFVAGFALTFIVALTFVVALVVHRSSTFSPESTLYQIWWEEKY